MTEQARRQELRTPYKQSHPEAGVYRIVNSRNNKALLGSSSNLASIRNKLEILDVLETRPEMTAAEILEDLSTLEDLWREQIDASLLY